MTIAAEDRVPVSEAIATRIRIPIAQRPQTRYAQPWWSVPQLVFERWEGEAPAELSRFRLLRSGALTGFPGSRWATRNTRRHTKGSACDHSLGQIEESWQKHAVQEEWNLRRLRLKLGTTNSSQCAADVSHGSLGISLNAKMRNGLKPRPCHAFSAMPLLAK